MTDDLYKELKDAIINLEVMPSMRAIMTAGKALERDNTAGYNCSYLPIDDPKAFDEAMYILLCGTGVGFSEQSISLEHKVAAIVARQEKHEAVCELRYETINARLKRIEKILIGTAGFIIAVLLGIALKVT